MLNPFRMLVRWMAARFDGVGFTGTQRLEIECLIRVGLQAHHLRMVQAHIDRRNERHAQTPSEVRAAEINDLISMLAEEGWVLRIHARPASAAIIPFPANDTQKSSPSPPSVA